MPQSNAVATRRCITLVLSLVMLVLAACGGTKVYTIDKTMTYRDSLYNLSSVQHIRGREEVTLENGDTVNLSNMDKKQLRAFFDDNEEVLVTMTVDMDDQEMVYLRMKVDDYSTYNRMKGRFEDAMEDISDFMGDKKATQLKLR